MKVFISADMEGICGIVSGHQTDANDKEYPRAQRVLTAEVNAVIVGALRGGATEIVVNDSHGSMRNIILEELNPAARLVSGSPKPLSMMQGIDSTYQVALFVGYHAQAGTESGILDHTFSGRVHQVAINDIPLGETGLNASLAGYFGVPVSLVTGDKAVTEEAQRLLGPIEVVAVKEACGRNAAQCLPLKEAYDLVGAAAQRALERPGKPFVLPSPYKLAVDFARSSYADIAELIPGSRRQGARRVEFHHEDYLTVYKTWRAMVSLALLEEQ